MIRSFDTARRKGAYKAASVVSLIYERTSSVSAQPASARSGGSDSGGSEKGAVRPHNEVAWRGDHRGI